MEKTAKMTDDELYQELDLHQFIHQLFRGIDLYWHVILRKGYCFREDGVHVFRKHSLYNVERALVFIKDCQCTDCKEWRAKL
jgi:hypothetical protein